MSGGWRSLLRFGTRIGARPLRRPALALRVAAVAFLTAFHGGAAAAAAEAPTGSIAGRVYNAANGEPLDFANVVLVGTTFGALSRGSGWFRIERVPVGTYELRASFVGYDPKTLAGVEVNAQRTTTVEIRLKPGLAGTVAKITVTGDAKKIDVRDSGESHVTTEDEILSLPVNSVLEAVALNAGVVVQAGAIHVRGGRSGEVSFRIDGIPVDNPLGGSDVNLGLLSVANTKNITGGMDAEYGNASSAVIEYTTKSGGRRPEFDMMVVTDDYGRADRTYTNFDRLSLGFGGPTPFEDLLFYVSLQATWQDGEFLTTRNYRERKFLNGLVRIKDRASSEYNAQLRMDWKPNGGRLKMAGEMTLSGGHDDPYLHNWNTEGYVARIVQYRQARPSRFDPNVFIVDGVVTMYDGPWRRRAAQANYVDIRSQRDCTYCLLPRSTNQTFRAVRVVDFQGRGADPANPLYVAIDAPVFAGFQNPISDWVPELEGAAGDTNKVYYNAAEHVPTLERRALQLKFTLTHTLSPKTFYEVKLSRLAFDFLSTPNGKTPEAFETAGRFIWVPGRGPQRAGNIDYYTDPDVPFFVTAYDAPRYVRRNTITWLLRSDITSKAWRGHTVKSGLMLVYNDLDQAAFTSPGLQREFGERFGLRRNAFHNYQPEGSTYLQDRWEYEGMVVNAGVRFDFFSPGSGVGVEVHSKDIRRDVQRWQTQWSPRLGIAFPITDRDVFSFHYGRFIQFPAKREIFATQDVTDASSILGNPNLEPETSIAYQAAIKHQFTNTVAASFALFNKDYFGLVSSVQVTDDSVGVQGTRYVNRAYASSRGLELTVNKTFSRGWSFETAYTYSFADGVASSAEFGLRASGLTFLPTGELPLNWDQRHTVNTKLWFAEPGDWLVSLVHKYGSGKPWTPLFRFEKKQDPLLENSRRLPSTSLIDVHLEKQFRAYGRDLRIWVDGFNVTDERFVVSIEGRGVAPVMPNAREAYRAYATEVGRFGGAYLRDTDGDGQDEFFPVNDPGVFGPRRMFRTGLGMSF